MSGDRLAKCNFLHTISISGPNMLPQKERNLPQNQISNKSRKPKTYNKYNQIVLNTLTYTIRLEGNLVKALNHCRLENMKKLIEP